MGFEDYEIQVGREKKGDLRVGLTLGGAGLEVQVFSKVQGKFEEAIYESVDAVLKEFQIDNAKLGIFDEGAFDFAIRARVEAAIRRAKEVKE